MSSGGEGRRSMSPNYERRNAQRLRLIFGGYSPGVEKALKNIDAKQREKNKATLEHATDGEDVGQGNGVEGKRLWREKDDAMDDSTTGDSDGTASTSTRWSLYISDNDDDEAETTTGHPR